MIRKLLAGLMAVSLATFPAEAQSSGLDARVDINVSKRSLGKIVDTLRGISGANVVITEEAAEREVDELELTGIHWREALELAAEKARCVVDERSGEVLMVSAQVPVEIDIKDGQITDVIDMIARMGGANVVWSPEVAGTISLRLRDVPWRHALDVAVKTLGYVVVEEDRGVLRVVDPVTLQAQMETKSYQLRYLRPRSIYRPMIRSEFIQPINVQPGGQGGQSRDVRETFSILKALEKALSPGGELDYIEMTNVVIVRDTAHVHESIKEMLGRLDIEPASVFLDVKFVSTLNADLLNLGVDYGDEGPTVNLAGGQIPISFPFGLGDGDWEDFWSLSLGSADGHGGPSVDSTLNPGSTVFPNTVFGALNFTGINPTLRLLKRDTSNEVIQAPKIIAIDGHEATIFVGETVRYAEAKSEQGQAGGLQLSLQEADNSPVEIGFQLLCTPHVIPGTNRLTLDVIPKETSLSGVGSTSLAPPGFDVFTIGAAGLEGSIALPRTRSSTIVTTMLLESGQTGVIGGLTTDSEIKIVSRVPFISKIPVVGELFKYRQNDRQRRSLLVFLTPTVVHTTADTERILQQELDRRTDDLRTELEEILYLENRPEGTDPWAWEDEAPAQAEAQDE